MIFIEFLCPDEINKIDKDRPSLEQTLLLHEETKLLQSGKGMPFTVCACMLLIFALTYLCVSLRASAGAEHHPNME